MLPLELSSSVVVVDDAAVVTVFVDDRVICSSFASMDLDSRKTTMINFYGCFSGNGFIIYNSLNFHLPKENWAAFIFWRMIGFRKFVVNTIDVSVYFELDAPPKC